MLNLNMGVSSQAPDNSQMASFTNVSRVLAERHKDARVSSCKPTDKNKSRKKPCKVYELLEEDTDESDDSGRSDFC